MRTNIKYRHAKCIPLTMKAFGQLYELVCVWGEKDSGKDEKRQNKNL